MYPIAGDSAVNIHTNFVPHDSVANLQPNVAADLQPNSRTHCHPFGLNPEANKQPCHTSARIHTNFVSHDSVANLNPNPRTHCHPFRLNHEANKQPCHTSAHGSSHHSAVDEHHTLGRAETVAQSGRRCARPRVERTGSHQPLL
jgi:hypothetical protein